MSESVILLLAGIVGMSTTALVPVSVPLAAVTDAVAPAPTVSPLSVAIDAVIGLNSAMHHSDHRERSGGGLLIPELIGIIAAYATPFVTTKTVHKLGDVSFSPKYAMEFYSDGSDRRSGSGSGSGGTGVGWTVLGVSRSAFNQVSIPIRVRK